MHDNNTLLSVIAVRDAIPMGDEVYRIHPVEKEREILRGLDDKRTPVFNIVMNLRNISKPAVGISAARKQAGRLRSTVCSECYSATG